MSKNALPFGLWFRQMIRNWLGPMSAARRASGYTERHLYLVCKKNNPNTKFQPKMDRLARAMRFTDANAFIGAWQSGQEPTFPDDPTPPQERITVVRSDDDLGPASEKTQKRPPKQTAAKRGRKRK